jgi:putative oxidoreductase
MSNQPLPNTVSEAPLGPAARLGNTAFATSLALLVLRLALGWTFIFHGAQKVFGIWGGKGMEPFAEGLAKMGLPGFLPPMAWAYMAAYGELLGGVMILLGLLARLGTLPIIVTMIIAIAKVHGKNGFSGWSEEWHGRQILHVGYEYNVILTAMAVAILVAGPGLLSLDALLFRRGLWARGPQPLSQPGVRDVTR